MPTDPILGISPKPVREAFEEAVRQFEKEYDELLQNRAMIQEYETERAQRIADQERRDSLSLPWWVELIGGVVFEPADIAMSLRDLVVFGNPAGLVSLLPFVPNSVTSRLSLVARSTRHAMDMLPGITDVANAVNRGADAIAEGARALGRRFDHIDGGFRYNYGMTPAFQGAGYGDDIVFASRKKYDMDGKFQQGFHQLPNSDFPPPPQPQYRTLHPNMEKAGIERPYAEPDKLGGEKRPYHAHHIIPFKDKNAEDLQNMLEEFGIDIDDPVNGVYLHPDYHQSIVHRSNVEYAKWLTEQFSNVETREDMIEKLNEIAEILGDQGY